MISLCLSLLLLPLAGGAQLALTPPASIASLYGLTSSTSFAFPAATLSPADAASYLASTKGGLDPWSIAKKSRENAADLSFVTDPFDTTDKTPVLQVLYPNQTDGGSTGGAQFTNLFPNPNTTEVTASTAFQSMLLSYEVAFDKNFTWVKGGKLPGLRGGPDMDDCDGGSEPKGNDCFSTRLLWTAAGSGAVYASIRTESGICKEPGVTCDLNKGTTLQSGTFAYKAGAWNRISLLIRLNNPVHTANGDLQLYFNDQLIIHQADIQFRNSPTVASVGGVFFSTFFGGSDSSWATPENQHSFFRNIQLFGGTAPSDNTGGKTVSAAPSRVSSLGAGGLALPLVVAFGLSALAFF